MAIDTLKRIGLFLLLCLVQALVLNHIHLFGMAIPLLYVYFIIMIPRNYPRWATLLWAFALGLTIDMFANTPGVAAASLTLTGLLQPYLLELFLPRDAAENTECSAHALGFGKFLALTLILVVIYCLLFFALEAFNFFNWRNWLMCAGSSSLLTAVLIMTLESIRK